MRNSLLFIFVAFLFENSIAQQYAGLSIDNDLFFGKDYYYSSGIFLQYGFEKNEKKSVHWRLGQQIFNPIKRYDSITKFMDYPFSGYLFLERQVRYNINKNKNWGWGFQIGLSGPPSLSKPIQNTYHQYILNLPPLSWHGQQPAGFHIGIEGAYKDAKHLGKHFFFTNQLNLQLGTHLTEASLRTGLQWGQLNPFVFFGPPLFSHKSGWGTHLGVQLKYNLHDYNLSGSYFRDNSPFTLRSNAFRNTLEAGVGYSGKHWQFIALAKARSKDTPRQKYSRHQVVQLSVLKIF